MRQISSLTPAEVKETLKFFIRANQDLEERGKLKNSINIVSEAGLGKTSIMGQTAEELGMVYQKLLLSTTDELGDLVGYPYKQHLMVHGDTEMWVSDKEYDFKLREGWKPVTNRVRTAYAPPSWVEAFKGKEKQGGILNIDDSFRCLPHFNQAIMSLIDRGEYYDWKLPKNVHIVMTNNPDNGEYFRQSQDQAQETRYFTYNMVFDIDSWAEYAENDGIDGRCINFMLRYHNEVLPADEEVSGGNENKLKTNPRQWTKFFNAIGGIRNFNTPKNLGTIKKIGEGIIGEHVSQFTHFINNRLDQLIEPERMLFDKDLDSVVKEIKNIVGDLEKEDTDFNAAIASILMTRFTNYTTKYVKSRPLTDEICERIEGLVKAKVFGEDLNWRMFRDSCNANSNKFAKLVTRPFFIERIMGKDNSVN